MPPRLSPPAVSSPTTRPSCRSKPPSLETNRDHNAQFAVRNSLAWLTVLLLCAVAIAPLLRTDSPCTHDGGLHYFRVVAMRHALQDGILFTRYLPDLAFGYGYPFFNYRAALSYYLALALYLIGLPLPVALNLVYVLSIVGSALAAYLLARDLFGPQAGLIAAVAYAYAPYQFLDGLLRANMPESVALLLMPLILWAFRRLALTGKRRWFLASIASLAALLLTHNISSLLFAPFLIAYLSVLWLVHRREGHWMAVGGAFTLAFGLTAFFLGPALLEQDYVQLHMSRVTRNNDFHYNFLPPAEILAPPTPVDTSLMNPPMRIHLGLVQTGLAMIGFAVGMWRPAGVRGSREADEQGSREAGGQEGRGAGERMSRGTERPGGGGAGEQRNRERERRATLIFFAASAALFIFMSTRASLWLWEHIPLLPFVQFPWRFIGRAALPLALLAGAIAPMPHAPRPTPHASRLTFHVSRFTFHVSRALPFISVTLLILAAFPSTYPPRGYCPGAPHPTIGDVFAYEHRSKLVGVDPEGSYFPVWVERRPDPEKKSPLEEQYETGGPITRFDVTALPTGASIVEADYGPNQARVVVNTPTPFRARYLVFYFPGWRVTVDGEPVPVIPARGARGPTERAALPDGLISFDVPSGRHTIVVRFGETPLRLIADAISLLSLAALLILALHASRLTPHASRFTPHASRLTPHASRLTFYILIATTLLVFKLALVDRTATIFRYPRLQADGTLPGIEHPLKQRFADGMLLLGYDLERATMPADEELRVDLYWTVYARPIARYQTTLHLVDDDGFRWSLPGTARPRGYADYPPTDTWDSSRYALDSHIVIPLTGTPPGDYDLVLTVFDKETLAPLSVLNAQGQPAAPDLTLGRVTLTRPHRPPALPEKGQLDLKLGDFTLLTAAFDREQAAPGDAVYLTCMWYADYDGYAISSHFHKTLSLLDADGGETAVYWIGYPVGRWERGDVWRSQHRLVLPADLSSGDYTWAMGLSGLTHSPVGGVAVVAPPHTFVPPPVDLELDVPLDDLATLVGADVQTSTAVITVTLVWRAEATGVESYHVFVHLIGPDGNLVAQSDSIPAGWTRPTTGWLPGEYITDVHLLTIPPDTSAGDYTLFAGLYLPGRGRLTAPDGTDAIPLTIIRVEAR